MVYLRDAPPYLPSVHQFEAGRVSGLHTMQSGPCTQGDDMLYCAAENGGELGRQMSELIPIIYQYGVGGIVFVLGLVLVTRAGTLDLKTRHGKRWFAVLVAGFVLYLCVHVFFQFVAPRI